MQSNDSAGQRLEQIAQRYGLAEIYAFGSRSGEAAARLRGEKVCAAHPQSDLDIGVRVRPDTSLRASERVQLTLELEDLMDVSRIDLVILQEADPFLAIEIIRGELLYAEDMDSQARNELYVLARAGDLLPLKKERTRMILEEGAR